MMLLKPRQKRRPALRLGVYRGKVRVAKAKHGAGRRAKSKK